MGEAIFIVISLGLLELGLFIIQWRADRKELREQTQLLEDIAVSLSLRENNLPTVEEAVKDSIEKNKELLKKLADT